MNLFSKISALALSVFLFTACTEDSPITSPRQQETTQMERGTFAKGTDVSWLTQLEQEGYTFNDSTGIATECMQLLRDECHVNAIRLRVWVNPTSGWNNAEDVLVKARRAKSLGLRVMIDFHFSDTWADPANQETPAAWADYSLSELKTAVTGHVTSVLSLLNAYGVEPEWVQIGNETRLGMLWPTGKIDTSNDNYAELVNAGYDATKAVFPNCSVIIHLDSGDNLGLYTYVFDYLKAHGGKYDIIGMSLYPEADTWQTMVASCISNISKLHTTYGKHVMICEIGMNYQEATECRDLIATLRGASSIADCFDGIFYWEPEAPAGYNSGYNKGCFDNGSPTVALDAFE